MTAVVASAHPLTDAQAAALKAALKDDVGKDVTLAAKVDPSLIGGLIVKLGSRMVDSSLKTKLSNLSLSLKGGPLTPGFARRARPAAMHERSQERAVRSRSHKIKQLEKTPQEDEVKLWTSGLQRSPRS